MIVMVRTHQCRAHCEKRLPGKFSPSFEEKQNVELCLGSLLSRCVTSKLVVTVIMGGE